MNCYAYPIIFDAMKSKNDNFLCLELMNCKTVYISRKGDDLFVKYSGICFNYTPKTFNFSIDTPILKITLIGDKYGSVFHDIFNKEYWKASTIIQNAWRNRKM
uniref:Uncharacterized protein n=1 Tax=viral metagenome TaxID=1070528 RepID=A0A6C0B0N6_9ZZZZ